MSDTEETVKLEVTLGYSFSINSFRTEEYDTDIPVDEWNEMSSEARNAVFDEAYDVVHQRHSQGGARVITEGAAE